MIRTAFGLAVCLSAGLLAAGCGGGGTTTITVTQTETVTTTVPATTVPNVGTIPIRIYFLRDGKVAPVERRVPVTPAIATAALEHLLDGPTDTELQLGYASALQAPPPSIRIDNGIAFLTNLHSEVTRPGLAQIVYTVSQFPTIDRISIAGRDYGRPQFEDVTPAILVESPLPFQQVSAPLRVRGTANTFEATFEYELTDPDGRIVKSGFTTATSGSGTRGTFDFTIPFEFARDGVASLIVFERSAADGSRTHLVEIPVRVGG